MSPRLSVIIPVLNEATALPALLNQLAPLRAGGHELILVDGGSEDGTLALAQGRVDQLLHSPPGRARQMNRGARAARGEWLWFVHADSQIPAAELARFLSWLAHATPGWGRWRVRLSGAGWRLRLVAYLMNARSCLTGVATGDQALFIHRDWFMRVGGFADIPLMEDVAICKRLRRLSWPHCLDMTLVTSSRRWREQGVWRTIALMWWLRWQYWLGVSPERLVRRYYPGRRP